jgi:hypothetical protein
MTFEYIILKKQTTKAQIDKWDHIKMFCTAKKRINRMTKQSIEKEEKLQTIDLIKASFPKYTKKFYIQQQVNK